MSPKYSILLTLIFGYQTSRDSGWCIRPWRKKHIKISGRNFGKLAICRKFSVLSNFENNRTNRDSGKVTGAWGNSNVYLDLISYFRVTSRLAVLNFSYVLYTRTQPRSIQFSVDRSLKTGKKINDTIYGVLRKIQEFESFAMDFFSHH